MIRATDLVVLSDFDGTVIEEDIFQGILDDFGQGDWRRLDEEYAAGRITLLECMVRQTGMVTGRREELVEYVLARTHLRPGFPELVAFCAARGVALEVVSAGMDFYIEAVFDRAGLKGVPFTSFITTFAGDKFSITPPALDGQVTETVDNFKEHIALGHKARGKQVLYVGDGVTDFPAACQADHVFARGNLWTYCRRAGKKAEFLTDFHAVRQYVERLLSPVGTPAETADHP